MDNAITRLLYDHSPPLVQDLYTSIYGWTKIRARYTGDYERWFAFYRTAQSWTRTELEAYQAEQVRHLARVAYDTTPFWRRRFDEAGIGPQDLRTPADLVKLPLLEKDEVRRYGEQMISTRYPRRDYAQAPTGGSTGLPLLIYTPRQVLGRYYGFLWGRQRHGLVRLGEPFASFTGLQLVSPARTKPPFWRRNWAARQTCYSVFHLRPDFMEHYVRDLNSREIVWWEGYGGAMAVIASFIEQSGIEFTNFPRVVLPCCEELSPGYRETLSRVLRARVWDHYGNGEMAGAITEYECGHYHVDLDYSVIEMLPFAEDEGETIYEMVVTGFVNDGWPLIRYRIGDLCTLEPDTRCPVHAGPVVKRIHGRTGHVIRTPDGHMFTNISVITKKCRNIQAMQVVQERLDQLVIRVVKAPGFTPGDEDFLLHQFRLKYGGKLELSVCYVDALEKTRGGKVLSIISRLPGGSARPPLPTVPSAAGPPR
jgi:phenylacetate-CoA ligase